MKGNPKVLQVLNGVLKAELTAINQYMCHAEMCENWGYRELSTKVREEAMGEMKHAELIMERILFLDGMPNMSDYFKINIGKTVKEQLENDLALELDAVPNLNEGIKTCLAADDNGTRDLLQKILDDEERHVDFLESQLHVIKEIGIQNYLTQQMGEEEEGEEEKEE